MTTSDSDQEETAEEAKKAIAENIQTITNVTSGLFGTMAQMTKHVAESGVNLLADVQKEYSDIYNYAEDVRKSIGGINEEMMMGKQEMSEFGKIYIEGFEHAAQSVLFADKAVENFGENVKDRFGVANPLLVQFGGDAVAAGNAMVRANAVIGESIDNIARKMTDEQKMNLISLQQSMRMSDDDLKALMERQYAYTGEASTKMIEEIANVSVALGQKTGIAQQELQDGIIAITSDFTRFGDIGVDAAGRIAAKVRALGLDIETVNQMTDQFLNFDTAADKMGELSALFGIQLDAMEMTYLANEDREEFMTRIRDEILDSGVDIENMSHARERALAEQLGLNIKQMKTFLREGEMAFDDADLAAATSEDVMNADGVANAYKEIGVYTQQNVFDAEKLAKHMRSQAVFSEEARQSSYKLMKNTQDAQIALSGLEIPEKTRENIAGQVDAMAQRFENSLGTIESTIKFVNEKGGSLADLGSSGFLSIISAGLVGDDAEKQREIEVYVKGKQAINSDSIDTSGNRTVTKSLALTDGKNNTTSESQAESFMRLKLIQAIEEYGIQASQLRMEELEYITKSITAENYKNVKGIIATQAASGEIKVQLQVDGETLSKAVVKHNGGEEGGKIVVTQE